MISVRCAEIPKMGRKAVDSNTVFIDGLKVPVEDRIGEEETVSDAYSIVLIRNVY